MAILQVQRLFFFTNNYFFSILYNFFTQFSSININIFQTFIHTKNSFTITLSYSHSLSKFQNFQYSFSMPETLCSFPFTMTWPTTYHNRSYLMTLLPHMRGIFKIIYNFVISEIIKNYRQTWWSIFGNSTMLIKFRIFVFG